MKIIPLFALVILFLSIESDQSVIADPLILPQYGFQIDPLDQAPGSTSSHVVDFFLPPADGFAPNVNVQIQPYPDDAKAYAALSEKQFDQAGLKVISEKFPTAGEWDVEYTGSLRGLTLHWYARAVLNAGKAYLVTATATETSWSVDAEKLKASVNSMKLK